MISRRVEFAKMMRPRLRLPYQFDDDDDDEEARGPADYKYFIYYTFGSLYSYLNPNARSDRQPTVHLYINKWGSPVV